MLGTCPAVELVGAFGHDEALAWAGDWATVDVLVVDAADEDRAGDQFPGVSVVRTVRAVPDANTLIIVVTGHYLHDGLRHRMAKAKADFFFLRSDLRSPEALLDVVLHPEHHRRGVPGVSDTGLQNVLGVGPYSDIEAFVSHADQRGLGPALDPDEPVRTEPRSRKWHRHRRDLARAGRIEPVNMTTGDRPRGQDSPSLRQLSRLWAWAARIHRPG